MSLILLVEDDQTLVNMYSAKFKFDGFDLVTAKDGQEGLDVALKRHPDIILMDILMPKMNGMDMLGKIREDLLWGAKVPVIILTNVDTSDDILKDIVSKQPSYYFIKSNTTPELVVEKVKEVLTSGKE